MALKIRLRRMGRKKAPHYRIVVAESSMPRDGRFVQTIGHYNPRTEPMTLVVDREKALGWIGKGAKPTDTVNSLLKKAGVYREPTAAELAAQAATNAARTATATVAGAVGSAVETVTDVAETVVERVQDAAAAVAERIGGEGENDEEPAQE